MESLAADAFALTLATASGMKTKGERAGHSQVSIWRNWAQTDTSRLAELRVRAVPDGMPLPVAEASSVAGQDIRPVKVFRADTGFATERIGLVLPTSLWSSQISRLAADRLNERQIGRAQGIARFVALAHTEACGSSGDTLFQMLGRSYRGYLTHPNVAAALLLEHGCEKITNDAMHHELKSVGLPPERFGWASVQLDGGIAKALDKIEAWFRARTESLASAAPVAGHLGALALGLMTGAPVGDATATALATVARKIIAFGGSVLIPESDPLLANPIFRRSVLGAVIPRATLAYGQSPVHPGLHVVGSETEHWVENLTGLGACGAHLALTVVSGHARQGHPMLAVIQVAESSQRAMIAVEDADLFLSGDALSDQTALEKLVAEIASGERTVTASTQGFVDFQFTRGLLGVTS
jgi:altronate dehydratase